MIAHDELVARQGIQRILELGGLGDRKVARVGHAVELALQQRLAAALAQESERLGEHEGDREPTAAGRTCRRPSASDIP